MSPPVPSPLSLRAAAPRGDSLWVSLAPRGRRSIFFLSIFFFFIFAMTLFARVGWLLAALICK